jgi:uncharacterized membrane protein YphA (DoxX/SURF4 family)
LGVALFAKGAIFVTHVESLVDTMNLTHVPAASIALAHYVALAHLAGGLMLAVGLATRLAAGVQVPILLGAVLFVHRTEGFFTGAQGLELAVFVLFSLVLLTFSGGGRFSVDHYLAMHEGDADLPAHT